MLLPDARIIDLCTGDLPLETRPLIEPFVLGQVQPASYDLTLGHQFCFPDSAEVPYASKEVILRPKQLLLGCTRERLSLPPDLAGQVEGKSGNARRGIQVETAGHVDPGYCGIITLEIYNLSTIPLRLHEGMGIAKVVFHVLESPCIIPYNAERNRHQYSHSPQPV